MKLRKRSTALMVLLGLAVAGLPAWAQDQNADAKFRLDVTPGDDTQIETTFSADEKPTVNRTFTVVLVLDNARNLMGANCDLDFDEAALEVMSVQETDGDLNFDGRVNIFDVREVGARFGATPEGSEVPYSAYFDLNLDDVIDSNDIGIVAEDDEFNTMGLFLTSNDPVSTELHESAEIFENPAISNQNGFINDIVFALLARPGVDREAFSFTGDARIAEITFSAKEGFAGDTTIGFITDPSDPQLIAIDAGTTITTAEIIGESTPEGEPLTVTVLAP